MAGANERENIEITREILRVLGKPEALIRPVADRIGHDRRYSLDASKLRALGWSPVVPFASGLAGTVRWYAGNEWWWQPIKDHDGEFARFYSEQYGARLK